jgi:ethanolamine utilization cobalamin adenosyltransferase
MKPITEQDIRIMIKKDGALNNIVVPKNALLTPSAVEFLYMNNIAIEYSDACQEANYKEAEPNKDIDKQQASKPLFYAPNGEALDHKPESMTHIHGNHLVYKDHPIILWRGKLDSLTAEIIEVQAYGEKKGNKQFVSDLQEVLDFIRHMLPCEYKGIPLKDFVILGLSSKDMREQSHNPLKYYGVKHILVDYRMGDLSIKLNILRAKARETEVAATTAFKDSQGNSTRDDIIEALNRLSSLFYILTLKYLSKNFTPKSSGI